MSRLSKITKKISSAGKSAKAMVQGLGMCTIAAILIIVVIVIFVIVPLFRKKKQDNFYYEGFADEAPAVITTTTTPIPTQRAPRRAPRRATAAPVVTATGADATGATTASATASAPVVTTPKPPRVARTTPPPTENPACEKMRQDYIETNKNIRRYRKNQGECQRTINSRDEMMNKLKSNKCKFNGVILSESDFYVKNPPFLECKN